MRVVVDGRFTNAKLLKNLPPNTTLIGRIRRDAKLFFLRAIAAEGQTTLLSWGVLEFADRCKLSLNRARERSETKE